MTNYVCPHCEKVLVQEGRTYKCENNHSFDIAKQGYVNLLLKQKASGDDKVMVEARKHFLELDHYAPLRDLVLDLVSNFPNETLLDAGCGEGYYTNFLQANLKNEIYGFDVSKLALQSAAKANKAVHYAVASIFNLPISANSMDLAISLFAPVATDEMLRVLKEQGILIVVMPNTNHLIELKQAIYDEAYLNERELIDHPNLQLMDEIKLNYQFEVNGNESLQNLFKMTPYYYKTSIEDSAKLANYDSMKLTADFSIQIYLKK